MGELRCRSERIEVEMWENFGGDVMGDLRWRCGRIEGRCDGWVEVEMWEN